MKHDMGMVKEVYKYRRDQLRALLKEQSALLSDVGAVILFAGFEHERTMFRQDSSFYYLTGVKEPGAVLVLHMDGHSVLYIPNYGGERAKWVNTSFEATPDMAEAYGVDEIKLLGEQCPGYSINPFSITEQYDQLISDLHALLAHDSVTLYTVLDENLKRDSAAIIGAQWLLKQLPRVVQCMEDCSEMLYAMRRSKDQYELDCMLKAATITAQAHEVAIGRIFEGAREKEVQALIESVFTSFGCDRAAFPSIVASGRNSTILHYISENAELKNGDLLVVDIGAEYDYYAADVTRTYPVSGKFTLRQREVYLAVLETQRYIEGCAQPGMYLHNPQYPDQSLHHLAVAFLRQRGYDKYFVHGIGHFLGLDTHDVGDRSQPLNAGDVITIEPGIYIPQEDLGVRIEDDYVIVDDGAVALTEGLAKTPDEIEALMARVREV